LGGKIIEFNNWEMPVYYTNVIDEHLTTRSKAGLFDTCHMGIFFVEGKDSFKFVQKLITKDLNKLVDGKAFYSAICLDNGGVVDDSIVYRFNHNKFMIVVNAGDIEGDFKWFLKHKDSFDTVVINKTNKIAKLDIQGPRSEEILQKLTNAGLKNLKRFHFVEDKVNNVATIISRTGYTAEDGFELYFSADKVVGQWNKLLEVGKEFGLKPVGLGARDTLRTEACYSLYGHELTKGINPLEAGIGYVISFDKEDFIGKEVLLKIKGEGVKRKIIAFEMLDRGIPRQYYAVFKNGVEIGKVTSGTLSPTFKKGIGLALIKAEYVSVGGEIKIKIREKMYKARIVERPFYKYKDKI